MHFLALAADYDGTIANHGSVDAGTLAALKRLKDTGRRLILVTGRQVDDLTHAFADVAIFDIVVAENGGVLFDPASDDEHSLASPPSPAFIQRLVDLGIEPISFGRVVVATWVPHHTAVLQAIRDTGLELQIIFNKGAVMVLPVGVSKASGLEAALQRIGLSPHRVVGVGDAENDHAFLRRVGCAAAVANAVPSIKNEADLVLAGDHGTGVADLIDRIIADDGALALARRHALVFGQDRKGNEAAIHPTDRLLVVGESRSGKSQFAKLLTEQMVDHGMEFCVLDPEGDYDRLDGRR